MNLKLEEEELIKLIRQFKFGEITVKFRNGTPTLIEKGIEQIKLGKD